MTTDNIYAEPLDHVAGFRFDSDVVRVFPDMITRSVPGYEQIVQMIGLWAARYSQPHTNIYDLGCSLGAVTFAMRQQIMRPGCNIIAVDNSEAMIQRCQEILSMAQGQTPVTLHLANLQDVDVKNASFVVLNFTLQFIAPAERHAILASIFDGMREGGVLIVSEKIVFDSAEQTQRQIDIHHDFKRANGYTELEIAQKRQSLENVLIEETAATHIQRMKDVGFVSAETWFQTFNFASFIAIK